jgi:hypothetical protein
VHSLPKNPYHQYDGELIPRLATDLLSDQSALSSWYVYLILPRGFFHQHFTKAFRPECNIQRKRQELIDNLQNEVAPGIFSPRGVYDGTALMYALKTFRFTTGDTAIVSHDTRELLETDSNYDS